MNLTKRQEAFALLLFQDVPQREAWGKAGYSKNMLPGVIDSNASRLAKNNKVLARLAELRSKVANKAIMNVQERQERLTEIARGRLTDYQATGRDGGYINIGKESPNTGALSEMTTTTKYDEQGNGETLITRVKLHSPTQAIDLLNKMDKLYSDIGAGYQDNRTIIIQVTSEKAKDLTEKVNDRLLEDTTS